MRNKASAPIDDDDDLPEERRRKRRTLVKWLIIVGSIIALYIIVTRLLVRNFVVPTGAMEGTVLVGDNLLVNMLDNKPQRGRIIVFEFPGMRDQVEASEFQYYLKRCVAVAGDTLQIINKKVLVNGEEQPVPKKARFQPGSRPQETNIFPPFSRFSSDDWGPMRIPKKGDIIPLNDSTYTRYSTFIKREGHTVDGAGTLFKIDGKAATNYMVERDYCFGMGDNRDNSLDSRYWGFIPVDYVAGHPFLILYSSSDSRRNFMSVE